jgi:hypothetical protein
MAEYADEGVFPISRAQLWQFIDLHADPQTVVQIHPDIASQSVLSQNGDEIVVDRGLRFRKEILHSKWKLTARRPDSYAWEILDGGGPILPGSRMLNTYTEVNGGTKITSRGEVRLLKVPGFLTRRVLRGVFRDIDRQDRAFLRLPPE